MVTFNYPRNSSTNFNSLCFAFKTQFHQIRNELCPNNMESHETHLCIYKYIGMMPVNKTLFTSTYDLITTQITVLSRNTIIYWHSETHMCAKIKMLKNKQTPVSLKLKSPKFCFQTKNFLHSTMELLAFVFHFFCFLFS